MNNCLVKKYKGSTGNSSLPKKGKVVINFKQGTNDPLWFTTGEHSCHCEFFNTAPVAGEAHVGQTSFDIQPNSYFREVLDLSQTDVRAELSAYDFDGISINSSMDSIIGIESARYGDLKEFRKGGGLTVEQQSEYMEIVGLFNQVRNIDGWTVDSTEQVAIITKNVSTLLGFSAGNTNTRTGVNLDIIGDVIAETNLQYLGFIYGNIENHLPVKTIRAINCSNPGTGSWNNVVNEMRAVGRTSGTIMLTYPIGTMGGKTVRKYLEDAGLWTQMIANGGKCYLHWSTDSCVLDLDSTGYVAPVIKL